MRWTGGFLHLAIAATVLAWGFCWSPGAIAEPPRDEPLRPLPDPDLLRIQFNDGTVITGKLMIDVLTVDTDFGRLNVPVNQINRFRPGLESYSELHRRIGAMIESLGDDSFELREQAQQNLLAAGLPIRAELQLHADDGNAERARRIKALLEKLDELAYETGGDEAEEEVWIRGDTIETDEFTIIGRVVESQFSMETRYGTVRFDVSDVAQLQRNVNGGSETRKSISVGGQHLVQRGFKSSNIHVQPGDRVTISATGQIALSGMRASCTPDGSTNYGAWNADDGEQFISGTLLARIGRTGKWFGVGSDHAFTAERSGMLMLAIAMRPSLAGDSHLYTGQYDVTISVDRRE